MRSSRQQDPIAAVNVGESIFRRASQMKGVALFEGNVPTLIVLVDAQGKIVGRNNSNLSRGDDLAATYAGLKGTLATGQAGSGGRFELAALVMPATVEHIRAISSHGERMPAKSTYFYPKLLSGLVINPLE